ncbi:tetratricopeptide repeat protein [Micromonosporaceae bacterium Da 78-11]
MRTDLLLDQADDLLLHGRAGKAATLLTPVVGQEPDNVGAWQLLARARLELGQLDQALAAARSALRVDPLGLESLYWVSAAYTALGRHDLAIAAATTACAEDPGNPRLAERRGRALLAAGRTAEAEVSLRSAVEFAHYDPGLHVAHGIALFAAGRPLSAREAYGRALLLDPTHVRARTELRRLSHAERSVVDAASLVRVTDDFAESQRIRPGGRVAAASSGALGHLAAVSLPVLLVALLCLGVAGVSGGVDVPAALTVTLLCAAAAAAIGLAVRRR